MRLRLGGNGAPARAQPAPATRCCSAGAEPQAAAALWEVHPRQPPVELGAEERWSSTCPAGSASSRWTRRRPGGSSDRRASEVDPPASGGHRSRPRRRSRSGRPPLSSSTAVPVPPGVAPGDHVDVDPRLGGEAQDLAHNRARGELLPAATAGGPDHDLGDLVLAGELDHRLGRVLAGDLLPGARRRRPPAARTASRAGDVDSRSVVLADVEHVEVALHPPGHPGGPAHHAVTPGAPVMATMIRSAVSHTAPGCWLPR